MAAKGDGEDEGITLAAATRALELGADINATNRDGDTALHIAAGLGLDKVVQLLADKGAMRSVKNQRGQTPLAIATAQNVRGQNVAYLMPPDERKSTVALLRRLGATE